MESLAYALLEEEKVRYQYWRDTDVLLEGERWFSARCEIYDRVARTKGLPTLDAYRADHQCVRE